MKHEYYLKFMILGLSVFLILAGCNKFSKDYPESFTIHLENVTEFDRPDELVTLSIIEIEESVSGFNPGAFVVVENGRELYSQTNDLDIDGIEDQLLFITDLAAKDHKTVTIHYAKSGKIVKNYPKRTQAELSHKTGGKFVDRKYQGGNFQNVDFLKVPPEHTDHSYFIR